MDHDPLGIIIKYETTYHIFMFADDPTDQPELQSVLTTDVATTGTEEVGR